MRIASRPKIVLLGMMTKMPVAGVIWQTIHYLVGFQRLGYDVYYVEAHARTPSMLMQREEDDGSARAAELIDTVLRRFGLAGRWAFHALHDDGRCYGLSESQLADLYREAALIINLHGGTVPRDEHAATGRLVYLETDPVQLQIELFENCRETIEFLEPHCGFFTFAENLGQPDCHLPVSPRFRFKPTRQPVVCDFWESDCDPAAEAFTTIGNWQQPWRQVSFQGNVYHWSKHYEFLKFLGLPKLTPQPFELALASYEPVDRHLLESQGWRVRDALSFSTDVDAYRNYIAGSRAEFTVAKDQNVRLRSGWFSDRSATYLAAGRPVVTQDTGFSAALPTGEGLFAFSTMSEILGAVAAINADYARHARAARRIAREYFDAEVVLGSLLEEMGLPRRWGQTRSKRSAATDPTLVLTPRSRFPTVLDPETIAKALNAPPPLAAVAAQGNTTVRSSIVVVTHNNLAFNRLCLESVMAYTDDDDWELIVVDNASTDGTLDYLRTLARRSGRVRVVANETNRSFAAANNQGLALSQGHVLVLLNNDTLVTPGWLAALDAHLADPSVGLVGPVTNRAGNEAEISVDYNTLGEMFAFAAQRREAFLGQADDLRVQTMFCLAMRRDTWQRLGPLDERFEIGLFEDDDYSMRAHAAGYRVVCALDVFVHHFGQASIGKLAADGEYGRLFHANRRRWEEKWQRTWQPYARRPNARYGLLCERVCEAASELIPDDAVVAVVSKGDDELLKLNGRQAWHFPCDVEGRFAGWHPADDAQAIDLLEQVRADGAEYLVLPATSMWWLDFYSDWRRHLEARYPALMHDATTCVIYRLAPAALDSSLATVGAAPRTSP
ncbi:MAG: glycosyltransferase family 2 protein [Pirellulales bacterium]